MFRGDMTYVIISSIINNDKWIDPSFIVAHVFLLLSERMQF